MEYKALTFEAKSVDADQRTIEGYAATFDADAVGDVILRGAFANTLKERGGKIKVLWQHDMGTPIGKPVEMREDDRGLFVKSYIANTEKGNEALTLAREGIIDSMSIGFSVKDSDYDEKGIRVIKELALYEYSLVTMPANEAAIITGVKSITTREIERVLREAGLSRSQAKAISLRGVNGLREADEDAEAMARIAELAKAFSETARRG